MTIFPNKYCQIEWNDKNISKFYVSSSHEVRLHSGKIKNIFCFSTHLH